LLLLIIGTANLAAFGLGWGLGHVTSYKTGHEDGRVYERELAARRILAHQERRREQSRQRPGWAAPSPPQIRAKTGAFTRPQAAPEPSPDTTGIPAVRLALADTGEIRALTDAWIAEHTTGDAS
jgi:hypothetical protein